MNFQLASNDLKIMEELGFRKIDESHDFVEYLFKPNKTIRIVDKKSFSEQISIIIIIFLENGAPKEELFFPPMNYQEKFQIFRNHDFIDEFLIHFLEEEEMRLLQELAFRGILAGKSKLKPSELKLETLRSSWNPSILKYEVDDNSYDFRRPEFQYSLARTYIYKTKAGHPKGILSQIKEERFLNQVNWDNLVKHTVEYKSINKIYRKKIDAIVKEAKFELAAKERDALDRKIRELGVRDWPEIYS